MRLSHGVGARIISTVNGVEGGRPSSLSIHLGRTKLKRVALNYRPSRWWATSPTTIPSRSTAIRMSGFGATLERRSFECAAVPIAEPSE